MIIYLEHPEHGRKVANMEAEAVYDESHGWKRYNPDTPVKVEEPVRKYTRKEVPA
jgi:hypothetical protein